MNNLLVLFIFVLETIAAQNVSVTLSKKGKIVMLTYATELFQIGITGLLNTQLAKLAEEFLSPFKVTVKRPETKTDPCNMAHAEHQSN